MGKRRKKFHKYNQIQASPVQTASPAPAVAAVAAKSGGVTSSPVYQAHQAEYRAISSDLIRVAIINGFFLAAVLAIYFIDRGNPFLKDWFARVL